MARVSDISVQGTVLVITYSDCTTEEIDLCVDCGAIAPAPENEPGDWPPPFTPNDTRCRVAVGLGGETVTRLANYLSGLNLTTEIQVANAAYIVVKLAEYGWSITIQAALWDFTRSLYDAGGSGRGAAADAALDADIQAVRDANVEALYCALDETGEVTGASRQVWGSNLLQLGGDVYAVLADFLALWPLSQLREMAYNASLTTDTVDCSAIDCEPGGDCDPGCTEVVTTYAFNNAAWTTHGNYVNVSVVDPANPDSFQAGAPCELTLPTPQCVTRVDLFYYESSQGGWTAARCLIDSVQFDIDRSKLFNSVQCAPGGPTNDPGYRWVGIPTVGQVLRFEPVTTSGGGLGAIFCVKVTTCV